MIQAAQKFWDKQATRYDKGEKHYAQFYEDIIARTGKYLGLSDNVLDFGCATGTKTLELAKKVNHIHGLDISAGMIREATRKKDESMITNASFSQGTIFSAGLEKASFDAVVAYAVIHLLDDKENVIRSIHELLKPGGLFISTTACLKDRMNLINRLDVTSYLFLNSMGLFPLHLNLFRHADVEKLIEAQNFQIIEAEKVFNGMTASFIVARSPGQN